MEYTARRRINQIRRTPGHRFQLSLVKFDVRYGREKTFRVGMEGIVEDFFCLAYLHDAAPVHHRDAVGQLGYIAQVMSN